MKWFKHFTDALDDPFIVALMDNFQCAGYVAFFGLLEIIGKENGHTVTGKLEVEPSYLRRKLRISERKLKNIFNYCSKHSELSFDSSKEKWKFDYPKVLKIKDNHTANLQATNNKLALEVEEEVEVEEDKKKIKKKKPKKHKYGEHKNVLLTDKQKASLKEKFGEAGAREWVETLSNGMMLKDYGYTSHYHAILKWSENKQGGNGTKPIATEKIPCKVCGTKEYISIFGGKCDECRTKGTTVQPRS